MSKPKTRSTTPNERRRVAIGHEGLLIAPGLALAPQSVILRAFLLLLDQPCLHPLPNRRLPSRAWFVARNAANKPRGRRKILFVHSAPNAASRSISVAGPATATGSPVSSATTRRVRPVSIFPIRRRGVEGFCRLPRSTVNQPKKRPLADLVFPRPAGNV